MKPNSTLRSFLLLAGSSLLAASSLHATTVTWDANGNTATQTDGAGAWDTASQFRWWTGSTNVDWSSGYDVLFGNGGVGGAVTLASPTTVGSLTFNYNITTGYTLGSTGVALTINNGIIKNAGSQNVTFAGNLILGGVQTWNNKSGTISVSGVRTLDNGGFDLTFDGAGITIFGPSTGNSMAISGAGGIIKNGTGQLNLSVGVAPAHTFTGNIVVNGGSVGFQDSTILSGKNVHLTDGYLGGRFNSGFTWTLGLGTGANQIQITGGTSGFSGEGSSNSTFQIGTALSTLVWGTSSFNPTVLLLNGDHRMNANGKGTLANGIDLNGTTRTITSNHTNIDTAANSGFTITGAIINGTGTAGIIRTGIGNTILTAVNTYNGATTLNDRGSITLSGSGTINSTSALNLGGGSLRLVNTANTQRFADAAAITATAGGSISYENTSGATVYTETMGSLASNGGQTNIVLLTNQAAAGSQTLTLGGLTRTGTNTSAVTFSAATTGPQITGNKNMIVVTGSGTTTAGQIIGAWATTGTTAALQTDYAVYDGNYVRGANITANNDETSWGSTENVNLSTTATLTAARTVNTLRYSGAVANLVLDANNLETSGLLNGGSGLLSITSTGGALTTASGGGNLYVTTGSQGITSAAAITNNSGNVTLVKSGSSILTLNGANTFTGDIAINAGTLQIGTNATANGADLNSGSYAGNIFIGAGATLSFQTNANQTLSGIISGDGNLTKAYTGTLTLGNSNTYTGKTSIAPISSQGAAALIVSSFNSVVGGTASSSLGAPTTVANGTIDLGAGTQRTADLKYTGGGEITDRIINFVGNGSGATKTIDTSGTVNTLLKFTSAPINSNAAMTNNDIVLQGSSNGEFVGGLAFAFRNFTKSGTGTWTLGGGVGSTGLITVNAGTLALQQKSSIQGGLMSNWTAAKINVKSGATLALNVDSQDAAGISATSLDTLLTAISVANTTAQGLQSGAKLGIDTSTATGSTFTQGNAIANSTGGSGGAIHLTKLGTGTLFLDKTNTYTGATTVNGGTLAVGVAGVGSITSNVTVNNGGTLGGSGTITGTVTVESGGTHNAGNSPGIQTITGNVSYESGSIFAWDLASNSVGTRGNDYDGVTVTAGDLTVTSGAFFRVIQNAGVDFSNTFWQSAQSWTDIFSVSGTLTGWADDTAVAVYNTSNALQDVSGYGSFTVTGGTLNWTSAVPEPTSALAGLLLTAGLLRRRRNA